MSDRRGRIELQTPGLGLLRQAFSSSGMSGRDDAWWTMSDGSNLPAELRFQRSSTPAAIDQVQERAVSVSPVGGPSIAVQPPSTTSALPVT
jgi:hypothetical protein